jgi:N-acetylglutamate synthase
MITAIEELSLNAWPSFQTLLYDGWVIRFAGGYTRRANSINPLYTSTIDLDQKLRFCEGSYGDKKLPTVFKITSASTPHGLDEKLWTNGYRKDAPTSVQMLDLESMSLAASSAGRFEEELSKEWLDDFCRMSGTAEGQRKTLQQILINIVPRHCFASLKSADKVIACGMGVLQSGYVGLFDIVTDEAFRGQGHGQGLVENIVAWGKQNGAQKAYLQVMLNNPPALHLYAKMGFVEEYQYWYRIKA